MHGLARALANNAIVGVTEGFTRQMDVVGVGYKADVQAQARSSSRSAIRTRSSFRCPKASRPRPSASTTKAKHPAVPDDADADRHRQAEARAGRRRDAQAAQARPLQGQGRALRRRAAQVETRQDGQIGFRSLVPRFPEGNHPLLQDGIGMPATKGAKRKWQTETKQQFGGRFIRASAASVRGTQSARAWRSIRSLNHIYAQVIDDEQRRDLASASTTEKDLRGATGGNIEAAQRVGRAIAERALATGIEQVVFDRGGYLYHGRIKALTDAAREAGLNKNERAESEEEAARGRRGSRGLEVSERRAMRQPKQRIQSQGLDLKDQVISDQPRDQGRQGRQEPVVRRAGRRRRRRAATSASARARRAKSRSPSRRPSRRRRRT